MLQFKEALEMFSNNSKYLRNYTFLNIFEILLKLDPVGSTVRYEMMKLCTGSV